MAGMVRLGACAVSRHDTGVLCNGDHVNIPRCLAWQADATFGYISLQSYANVELELLHRSHVRRRCLLPKGLYLQPRWLDRLRK